MSTQKIDLTSGQAKVVGNRGDVHTFRLTNPSSGQVIVDEVSAYGVVFTSSTGKERVVTVDTSESAAGVLTFNALMENGVYRLRRLNPSRTLLTVEVEAR